MLSLLIGVFLSVSKANAGNLPSPLPELGAIPTIAGDLHANTVIADHVHHQCAMSSMVQPYWVTQLGLCQGKQAFDIIPVEPKDTQFYSEIVQYKSQNSKLKVIISIGGWNFPSNFFSQMASDKTSRTAFINSAKSFMSEYGFDGIDLDWEYPKFCPYLQKHVQTSPARTDEVKITCTQFDSTKDEGGSSADGANFVQLVSEMRSAFGADTIITVASQADMVKANDEDIKGLFDYIDMFNLMTYDYTVSDITDSAKTAPNQPLYPPKASGVSNDSTSVTINGYLAAGIPASKMSVGIAYYGHSWYVPGLGSAPSAWCKFGLSAKIQGECCGPFQQTYGAKYGQYSQLCGSYMYSEIESAGFETCYDNTTNSNIGYMISPQDGYTAAGVWMAYQDTQTVQAIVEFAKSKKLGGAFAFDISMDSRSGSTFTYKLTKEIASLEG